MTAAHHNAISHEEDQSSKNMDSKEWSRKLTHVVIHAAAEKISVAWRNGEKFWQLKKLNCQDNLLCFLFVPSASCSCASVQSVLVASMANSSFSRSWGRLFRQHGISFSQYISTSTAMGTGSWNKRNRMQVNMTTSFVLWEETVVLIEETYIDVGETCKLCTLRAPVAL